jgi:type IV pilus assembly protein PilB
MTLPFDTAAEDEKLAHVRQDEEEDLARILSDKYQMTYADFSGLDIDSEALRIIPEEEAREAESVAFAKAAKHLSLATRNPQNPAYAVLRSKLEEHGYTIDPYLVSKKSLDKAYTFYHELSYATNSARGVVDINAAEVAELAAAIKNLSGLKDFIDKTLSEHRTGETSRILEGILAAAFSLRASDIHLEPEELGVRLRLRIDGLLTDAYIFQPNTYRLIDSRLKILSGLKINVHDRAQDGRFSVLRGDTEVEIRTSLIPGNYGESYVMRILDPNTTKADFDNLGIHPKLAARLSEEIKRPTGMLLTTGPTGSGKTTTLYAFLRKIYSPNIKIVTIEDPIEYHLQGIVQTQTEGDKYTFASGLRSIVRQDPDDIMVGEIRDGETAEIAMQAALTGHFVFSTLHTNNAAGTFPRLVDLGIDPRTFGSAITVAMAQRLVRKLNPNERKQVPLTADEKHKVEKILSTVEDKSLLPSQTEMAWVPDPKTPDSTGYFDRCGLYEAIFMDDQLSELLRSNPSESEIAKDVVRQGFLTMAQTGVILALQGITSLEEVFSVVDIPRD